MTRIGVSYTLFLGFLHLEGGTLGFSFCADRRFMLCKAGRFFLHRATCSARQSNCPLLGWFSLGGLDEPWVSIHALVCQMACLQETTPKLVDVSL